MSDYKVLYRKWRPVDFDDVCGQESVTDILRYQVACGKIAHAYLFCGSRGTGKTSCAKILAKAVNCLHPRNGNPCNECEACRSIDSGAAMDVIEMDAASNNGVENVRDMKDEIAFTPALLKYRVYIIDEVHMMSGSAFNALLKTLEEPPSYVVFILATTEFHKLPATIVSRCQRFDFRRIRSEVIMQRLMHIGEAEGIDLTEGGARMIARSAQGGMRDAISILELCAGKHVRIDEDFVTDTLGVGNRDSVYAVLDALIRGDYSSLYGTVHNIVLSGSDIGVFWQDLIDAYRDMMILKNAPDARSYLDLTDVEYTRLRQFSDAFTASRMAYHTSLLQEALADMQRAVNSRRSIAEICLTRMCDGKLSSSPEALAARVEELEKTVAMMKLGVVPRSAPAAEAPVSAPTPPSEVAGVPETEPDIPAKDRLLPVAYPRFGEVVERIAEMKRSLSVQFNGASAYRRGNEFILYMTPFFATRLLANEENLQLLRGVLSDVEELDVSEVTVTVRQRTEGGTSPADELEKSLSDERNR